MNQEQLTEILVATLTDQRLTRSERKALDAVLQEQAVTDHDRAIIRALAFELARSRASSQETRRLLAWLEEVIKSVVAARPDRERPRCRAVFSPGTACVNELSRLFARASEAVDICVFTITDDRLTKAILETQSRGVALRLITDDDKTTDLGSDIAELARAGIAVVTDHSNAHMHHKFAVFDGTTVATGSYNWTRSAAEENWENLVVCDDAILVHQFREEFEKLWRRLS